MDAPGSTIWHTTNISELDSKNNSDLIGNNTSLNHSTIETTNNASNQFQTLDELSTENDGFEEICKADTYDFYEATPSSEKIASFEVAVNLWRDVISNKNPTDPALYDNKGDTYVLFTEKDEFEVVKKLEQNFSNPPFIAEVVIECLDIVKNEMIRWANYYRKSIFTGKSKNNWTSVKISDLLFCVWLPNGKIDDRKTALNMLSNARLTEMDTLKIMCKYCLEDSIKKLKPCSIPKRFLKKITWNKTPLIYYWICRIKDELYKIAKKKDESVESLFIVANDVDNWSAIEYLWDRLSVEEQFSKAEELLDQKPEFQKQLFFKMNESQRKNVLSKKPLEIMRNFFFLPSCERFAFSIWTTVVGTMTYEKFAQLFENLLNASLPNHIERLGRIVKMWHCSPSNLKTQALQSMTESVVSSHIKKHWPEWRMQPIPLPCNPDFLLAFLSYACIELRKNVLFQYGDELVLHNDSTMIDQLIELCLADDNDIVEFRKHLSNSPKVQKYCYQMLVDFSDNYDHDQLASFINYYLCDPHTKADFLYKLVLLGRDSSMNCWTSVIEFINKHLNIPPEETIELKKRIIWLFGTNHHQFRWANYHSREFLNDVVARVLDTEELKRYKNTALETFRSSYKWCHFDEESIRGFLLWCFDQDTQKMSLFKKSLSIDNIFDYFWHFKRNGRFPDAGSDEEIIYDEAFVIWNRILIWYFEKPEAIRTYKRNKALSLYDRRELDFDFLPQLFDHDQTEIESFMDFLDFEW